MSIEVAKKEAGLKFTLLEFETLKTHHFLFVTFC